MKKVFLSALLFLSCSKQMQQQVRTQRVSNANIESSPNVILILVDDLGFEVPTYNGGQSYSTPNIDRLSSYGISLTKMHSCPSCSPSRVELLTGKYNNINYNGWSNIDTTYLTIGNMFKNADYKTGIFGKWQLGGGDASITASGFKTYIVHDPFTHNDMGSRYKSPHLYTHGAFIPDSLTADKYGEDIVRDSLLKFMEDNVKCGNKFFAYYPMILTHSPFQPTPDDPEFASWNPASSNPIYYGSMVKYMDKVVGQVVDKVNSLGIANNTLIIFTTDNGSPKMIYSKWKNYIVQGGKHQSTELGTNVPTIFYWPNHTPAGAVDSSLMDFSDFAPTLADIINGSLVGFGRMSGVSFCHNVLGQQGFNRDSIMCYYDPHDDDDDGADSSNINKYAKWIQNKTYKLFDSATKPGWKSDKFFKYPLINETDSNIIKKAKLSPAERRIDSNFRISLNQMK